MIEERHARFDRVRHRQLVDAHQQVLGQPQLHFDVRHFLQHLGLDQSSCQIADVVADDGVAVERAMAVGKQTWNRAGNV